MKGYLFTGASILLVTFAQLVMKVGMVKLPGIEVFSVLLSSLATHSNALLWLFFGLLAYLASMACWMAALNYLPLNKAYPLLSLSYGLVYLIAVCLPWFNEPLTLTRSCGVGAIIMGILLMNRRRPIK